MMLGFAGRYGALMYGIALAAALLKNTGIGVRRDLGFALLAEVETVEAGSGFYLCSHDSVGVRYQPPIDRSHSGSRS